jgi:hypothetical protein
VKKLHFKIGWLGKPSDKAGLSKGLKEVTEPYGKKRCFQSKAQMERL